MSLNRSDDEGEEDMSYEQMQILLGKATKRMKTGVRPDSSDEKDDVFGNLSSTEAYESVSELHRLRGEDSIAPYISSTDGIAHSDLLRVLEHGQTKPIGGSRSMNRAMQRKQTKKDGKGATAGPDWFHLPETNLTPELKRDLQLVKMRGVLDPKRHYKTDTSKQLIPKFSEVGSIVEGPTEFFSSRVSNRNRKRTFVEEILGDKKMTGHFGNRYNNVQAMKASGKKSFYQRLKDRRYRGAQKHWR